MPKIPHLLAFGKHCHNCGKWMQRRALRKDVPHTCTDKFETYIFQTKQYVIENFPVSWEDAQILCRGKHNGSLAVLDSAEKAEFIAEAMAESQFSLESVWVGSRRGSPDDPLGYRWAGGSPLRRTSMDVLRAEDTYAERDNRFPVWLNRSRVPAPEGGADCVAVDRVLHDRPVFLDLPCRLQRAFVCETDAHYTEPVRQQRAVRCRGGLYRVYSGRQSWDQAAAYCVVHNMRLANIFSTTCLKKLGLAMLRSRPSIESAWVGARGAAGRWAWLDSGADLLAATRERDWPPLRDRTLKPEGCLQLDRHNTHSPVFLEARCERKMRFICYENTQETAERQMATAPPPSDEYYYYVLVRQRLSWQHAMDNCARMNGTIAFVDSHDILVQLLLIMGENREQPISHSWLAGQRQLTLEPHGGSTAAWVNPATGKKIPRSSIEASGAYVPPWLEDEEIPENACLNLDREDHLSGLVYGIPCSTQQHSICMIEKHPKANKTMATSSATPTSIETSTNPAQYRTPVTETLRETKDKDATRDIHQTSTGTPDQEAHRTTEPETTKMETEANHNADNETNNYIEKETASHMDKSVTTIEPSTERETEKEPEKNYVDKETSEKQETDKNEAERSEGTENNLN